MSKATRAMLEKRERSFTELCYRLSVGRSSGCSRSYKYIPACPLSKLWNRRNVSLSNNDILKLQSYGYVITVLKQDYEYTSV